MITTIRLVNISITRQSNLCVCVIYFLRNFQVYNTVLLTIVTVLYTTSPELIHLATRSLYSLNTLTYFTMLPASGNH